MKERPILFSGPMVRAILEGRKTQTRRVVKLPEKKSFTDSVNPDGLPIIWHELSEFKGRSQMKRIEVFHELCPHGTVGDRLWVRECFGTTAAVPTSTAKDEFAFLGQPELFAYRADNPSGRWCWKPSIHMPRWASRITLEITGVRVERLQDISDADVDAEGMDLEGEHSQWFNEGEHQHIAGAPMSGERYAFMRLWSSINGPESWDASPWVWVIEFKRLETA